jgi:hypothetical protein
MEDDDDEDDKVVHSTAREVADIVRIEPGYSPATDNYILEASFFAGMFAFGTAAFAYFWVLYYDRLAMLASIACFIGTFLTLLGYWYRYRAYKRSLQRVDKKVQERLERRRRSQ